MKVCVNEITKSRCTIDTLHKSKDVEEYDLIALGKAYFDNKEFKRCSHTLRGCVSQKGIFLRNFSSYLEGEKRKEEQLLETTDLNVHNKELEGLNKFYIKLQNEGVELDGFNLYLFSLIQKQLNLYENSKVTLYNSIIKFPCNWSAWCDLLSLTNCMTTTDTTTTTLNEQIKIEHWIKDFYDGMLSLELQENEKAIEIYERLNSLFPNSIYILSQKAIAYYNLREFDTTEQLFEEIQEKEPYRIEQLDTFSNILYVKENKAKLAILAQRTSEISKYSPETCCILGNYFSLKSDHEKAIIYFKRAIKLNNKYLSAWTLMGHEYVEMKNTRGAIEAYRNAVDINNRDYRAWYGLGQTYELLKMPLYALYYYNKAATLKYVLYCLLSEY